MFEEDGVILKEIVELATKGQQLKAVIMENIATIDKYEDLIEAICLRENLLSLSSNTFHSTSPDVNLSQRYFAAIECYSALPEVRSALNKIFCDFEMVSEELKYYTAQLYLFKPLITNPLDRGIDIGGKMVYPNIRNLGDVRFAIFINAAYQTTYNLWDKIADILAYCFETNLKSREIDFSKVINELNPIFFNDNNFNWLKSFKGKEYSELNITRKNIVHYSAPGTIAKYEHIFNATDSVFLENWQKKREESAEYFRSHLKLVLDGFKIVVNLLEQYPHLSKNKI